jgi:hypothetical protein
LKPDHLNVVMSNSRELEARKVAGFKQGLTVFHQMISH